jgi:branched-chain amino acid transport system ATP-binding protein
VVTGLQEPDAGSVHLGGDEITGWSAPRRARAGLGRTFQGARLFDRLSVRENVEVVALSGGLRRRAAAAKAGELLDLFDLRDVAESEARSLPHGTARRLGVARALALEPSFLLLDEPAAGLDETESAELVRLLEQIRGAYGVGLVVIEHDVPLIMACCDRIHVLHHGQTLAVGTPREIAGDRQVIEAYLGESGAQR